MKSTLIVVYVHFPKYHHHFIAVLVLQFWVTSINEKQKRLRRQDRKYHVRNILEITDCSVPSVHIFNMCL